MSRLIGNPTISEEALAQMRERGGAWAVYQGHALDQSDLGGIRFLKVGPECTFKTAPERYPDTQFGTGWAYIFVGWADLETGTIEEPPAAPTGRAQ
jgi:hypothetical protein